jgi:hypothetical protein
VLFGNMPFPWCGLDLGGVVYCSVVC